MDYTYGVFFFCGFTQYTFNAIQQGIYANTIRDNVLAMSWCGVQMAKNLHNGIRRERKGKSGWEREGEERRGIVGAEGRKGDTSRIFVNLAFPPRKIKFRCCMV